MNCGDFIDNGLSTEVAVAVATGTLVHRPGVFQIRHDGIIRVPAGAVVSDGYDGHPRFPLDPASHGLGHQGRTAEGRDGLHEEGDIRVMFEKIGDFQVTLDGFPRVFTADVVLLQDFFRRSGIVRLGL